jgi:hypothetical protein
MADFEPATVSDGDISTSPEALQVLHAEGVDAWREWVADQPASEDG